MKLLQRLSILTETTKARYFTAFQAKGIINKYIDCTENLARKNKKINTDES